MKKLRSIVIVIASIAALVLPALLQAGDPTAETKLGGMPIDLARTWWAFQPLPKSHEELTPRAIDTLIERKLEAKGLAPSPAADRRILIRRATYDLTGLPPTPEEVESFLADKTPDAWQKVIERLLASPQHGVQWGRHWLDVVRYADTAGENTDRPLPHAWKYRNWVFDAFNRDLPYDQFVQLQLAGDIMRAKSNDEEQFREGIIATGYLAISRRFGHDIDKDIHLMFEDTIDNLGKTFLGLTTSCARCHDHKYDPITAKDYYALYGILNSSRFSFPGCEPKGQPRDLVPLIPRKKADELKALYQKQKAAAAAEKARRLEGVVKTRNAVKALAAKSHRILSAAGVGEGGSVSLAEGKKTPLTDIKIRKGEVLQLAVLPNGNHGADSTLIEWQIKESGELGTTWNVADLIPTLTSSNPLPGRKNATWCFLDITDGPAFLTENADSIDGQNSLKKWSLNDLPSVFVNTSTNPVKVWTTLPPRTFFVHPGPGKPVAISWISPIDGTVSVKGRVADAHPAAGLDGVSFRLEHFGSPELGPALARVHRETATGASGKPVQDPVAPQFPVAYAVVESGVKNEKLHLRGDPTQPGEEVPRRWLTILGGDQVPADAGSGRLQLGQWIAKHPLSARVMVNRIWQWHFGQGLARTPNDFGSRGELPSHPELLDRLASQFVASGYSVQAMHRLIMQTKTYQRSSRRSIKQTEEDPGNRMLASFSRRRLSAEEIRDSLLTASGSLDPKPATAHPFPAEATWTFTQHAPFNAVYPTNNRSAYLMVQRQRQHPFLSLFDGADPNTSTALRETTTAPTQALYFLNDPFFHAQANKLADSLLLLSEDTRIPHAYRQIFQRPPDAAESEQAKQFLSSYPGTPTEKWSALARILLASNEFLHLD